MPSALSPVATSLPMRSLPSLGVRMQPRIDSSVVLPLPEGPISRVSSPGISSRLTPLRALTSAAPVPSTLTMLLASRMGSCDIDLLSLPAEDHRWIDSYHLVDGADCRNHAHGDGQQ